ncbi:MAG: Multidomain signal transduction protein including CheB-like methylesterase, CheR-like methyltransferase and BaeS-like histidine kinase [uncultured Chthoniobacterales bacterium]|uniref:protein-glutamate O-methyltransferase n=1 Tax=uncultured Chthoniobacterales bacterium TaxID=1836801 RepID=A0A6J4I8A2_9BACT|nr:MAG: Multidomain signal transduction protein including CheB-like methylesterase, CheR-like methyltransferase and BaeS-like histidine kinase [uncultured Chthoniobacterales bacterium]
MPEENSPSQALDPAATDETSENARRGAQKRRDPNEPAAVVGLGASAGGVAPLQQFFADMNPETGLAFVVVMHLSPEHESHLANIIQQKTSMPVMQVTEPVKVRPNHVYVIPPGQQLTFNDSMLDLVPPQQGLGRRVAIDLFFRTLAQAYGQRAVCMIFSGTDSDGVIGLKHIRAQGGLSIVQDPNEAEFDSMPATAISTGMVDWVLPVGDMAAKLAEFVGNEQRMRLPPEILDAAEPDAKVVDAPGGETVSDETRQTEDEEAIGKVLADVRAQTGHDFSHYKRATVLRRIARRLQVNSLESIPQYVEFLRTHPVEARALLQDLLIGVTHFFRDRDSFAAIESHIPQLFAGKKKDDEVRIWVAGCATGEEAYSIAMLLCEHAQRLDDPPSIQVFATDIDEEAIASARDGLYPAMIEADVTPERLREFFMRDHGRYRVRKEIREKVLFASHSLLKDAPFSRCDMISCRNLLIYLNTSAQKQVFDVFHFALKSGGLLFLGGAENHGQAESLFTPMDAKHRIFVRRSTPRPTWKVPILPIRAPLTTGRPVAGWRSRPLPALTPAIAEDAATKSVTAFQAGHARREVLFGELHLRLLEQYGPPSVVVNEGHDIVHLSQSAGRYLHFVAGEPTANITKVVHPELQTELRTALFKAAQTKTAATGSPTRVHLDGGEEVITVVVRPAVADDLAQGFFLVLFEKPADASVVGQGAPSTVISQDADEEIQFLKEQLNATVEQYEGMNEELKASNEELQAINEEMRSATEELETSKEELQSVNEELTTVNHELKSSVEELSKTNADLNNLMASSDIGTIFLDRQLRIHRFTPAAQRVFNLIPADLGRPISDITSTLKYEGFMADVEKVLHDLHTREREVQLANGTWHLTRIAPYRTTEDRIAGVVATFIEITRRKKAEDELRESEARMRRTLEIETVGVIFFTTGGAINDANDAFLRMSGYTREDLARGIVRWDTMTAPEFIEPSKEALAELQRRGKTTTYEKQYIRKDGSRWWGLFSAKALSEEFGVEFIVDVTDRKETQQALAASEERFRTIADNVPQVIWTNDANGDAVYFNRRFFDYTGMTHDELRGPGWQTVVHPDDAPAAIERWQQAFASGAVFDAEYRLRAADGNYRWFLARNVPLRENNGKVMSWFGSATDIQDLKEAQAALTATEEKFRLLVEGAPDYAMFLLDPENNITFWSSGAERVFGWTPEEAIGQKGSLIFVEEDLATRADMKEIEGALREGAAPDRRWHVRKDGTRLWLDGFMRRLNHDDGTLRGFAKVAREATEQKMADEKLRQAHAELEQRVHHRTKELQAMNESLEQEMAQRQKLERQVLEVSENERARISQDLHDSLCQELTATAFLLKSRAKSLAREDPEAGEALIESAEMVNRNAGLARDLARGLHPLELGSGGLVSALRELASRTSQTVTCTCECPRSLRVPSEAIAVNLYRIAQEAVTNALKHAKPTEVVICIERQKDEIHLVITDNGTPRRRGKRGGLGIQMMQYRANVSGGMLKLESKQGKGTRVTCRVPVKQ